MLIRYRISVEDHQAYQDAIRSAVPGFFQIRCAQSIAGPLFLLILLWSATYLQYGWWPTALGALLAPVLGVYLWRESPGLWRRARLQGLHHEGKLSGHLGEHSLELREDGLKERNAAGEHLSYWEQIENIYSTAAHTFFISKMQSGYILPESSVIEGDYAAFVATAIAKWKQHQRST